MNYLLMTCALGEVFLLWFLVGLIRESRRLTPRKGKADRTRRGSATRREEPALIMNSGTTQEETTEKELGQRTAMMAMDALPFTLSSQGQQT